MRKTKEKKTKRAALTWRGSLVQPQSSQPSIPGGDHPELIVIPNDYDVIPAVEWKDGRPHFFRVAVKKTEISGDFPVTKPRRRKSA